MQYPRESSSDDPVISELQQRIEIGDVPWTRLLEILFEPNDKSGSDIQFEKAVFARRLIETRHEDQFFGSAEAHFGETQVILEYWRRPPEIGWLIRHHYKTRGYTTEETWQWHRTGEFSTGRLVVVFEATFDAASAIKTRNKRRRAEIEDAIDFYNANRPRLVRERLFERRLFLPVSNDYVVSTEETVRTHITALLAEVESLTHRSIKIHPAHVPEFIDTSQADHNSSTITNKESTYNEPSDANDQPNLDTSSNEDRRVSKIRPEPNTDSVNRPPESKLFNEQVARHGKPLQSRALKVPSMTKTYEQVEWSRFVLCIVPLFAALEDSGVEWARLSVGEQAQLLADVAGGAKLAFLADVISRPDEDDVTRPKSGDTDHWFTASKTRDWIVWRTGFSFVTDSDSTNLPVIVDIELELTWKSETKKLVHSVHVSGDVVKTGSFKTWAWEGLTTQNFRDGAIAFQQRAINAIDHQWKERVCFTGFEQTTAKWRLADSDELLNSLARGLSRLGGKSVAVHANHLTRPSEQPQSPPVDQPTPTALARLKSEFPVQFSSLESAVASGRVDKPLQEAAEVVWRVCQTWLTFLDGDDFQFTTDRAIYENYVRFANTNPRCSIEEESTMWLIMLAAQAGKFLLGLAFDCGVERVLQVGKSLGATEQQQQEALREIRANADETIRDLVLKNLGQIRDRNPNAGPP